MDDYDKKFLKRYAEIFGIILAIVSIFILLFFGISALLGGDIAFAIIFLILVIAGISAMIAISTM